MGFFGIICYGVYMMVYFCCKDNMSDYDFCIWVFKCFSNKLIYFGMLDNIVVGGFMIYEDFFECIICEVDEEVFFFEDVMCWSVVEIGIVIYIFIMDEWLGGELGYIYFEC